MEITVEQIVEAIKTKPEIVTGILPTLTEVEAVKKLIDNKADSIFKTKIDEEISKTHSKYDDDMFAKLGERPGQKPDGTKEKTYEKLNSLLSELADLREKKDGLTKDAEVARLTGEIEKLKSEGGGAQIQKIFDEAKVEWNKKEQTLNEKIAELNNKTIEGQVKNDIAAGIASIKFNPDVSETVKKIVLNQVENDLLKNSKIENGKTLFLKPDGTTYLNSSYEPMNASEVLASLDGIKEISLKENAGGGGQAPTVINGQIKTTTVDGKDTKKLELPTGSFTTKKAFIEVAEKALIDAGITKRDPNWDNLKNGAYNDYNVKDLPNE